MFKEELLARYEWQKGPAKIEQGSVPGWETSRYKGPKDEVSFDLLEKTVRKVMGLNLIKETQEWWDEFREPVIQDQNI